MKASECKSPSSVCSDKTGRELTASFVFVEASLQRHATVIRSAPSEDDLACTPLMEGETKQAVVHDVKLIHPITAEGTLLLTSSRLLIASQDPICIGLCSILDLKTYPSKPQIDIKTKDSRFFQILLVDVAVKAGLFKLMHSLVFAVGVTDLLPVVRLKRALALFSPPIYRIENEAKRLGISDSSDVTVRDWNSDYSICATYPASFFVPAKVSRETLVGTAKFRDKGRIPIMSWCKSGFGSIWRSSQPKSSLLNRSVDDEDFLAQTRVMFIIDCRPMLNAYANIAHGAGVESLSNYHSGIELWFAAIQNIHHVRDAWERHFSLAQQYYAPVPGGSSSGWFSGLESGAWQDHICSVLKAASILVEKISSGISVLCRCSHGLDRTPQVVALAMLALDRHYRTITGFAILIEKEWVATGHKIHSRFCIGEPPHDDVSPIFAQWIECVYQLMMQRPDEFEFSAAYLTGILAGVVSGRFGNFLLDSERERIERGLLTHDGQVADSMWPLLWREKDRYTNHNFQHRSGDAPLPIDHRIASVRVFNELWLAHSRIDI